MTAPEDRRVYQQAVIRARLLVTLTTGSSQLVKQRPCLLEIGRVEALGERTVDRRQQFLRLLAPPAVGQKPREARRGTQFKTLGALLAGDRQGGAKGTFGVFQIELRQSAHQIAAQSVKLRVRPLLAEER